MKFTFVQRDNDMVEVHYDPGCNKMCSQLVAIIEDCHSTNPIIRQTLPFGMSGTLAMITKFKTWKAERE